MLNSTINMAVKYYLSKRYDRIVQMTEQPEKLQQSLLKEHLFKAKNTEYGKLYGFGSIDDYNSFRSQVPIVQYEDIVHLIERMMHGHDNILWPGVINWYAKSSGTTSNKSKFIPITKQNLYQCHIAAAWDAMSMVYHQRPSARMFAEKSLIMGGSLQRFIPHPKTIVGDVSAILLHHMPKIGRPFYTPDFDTALLPDMDTKIDKIIDICLKENVVMLAGVPTWSIVLFNKILERTGKDNILEVWPEASLYMHGGVGFKPYKKQFASYFPSDDFNYMEVYNASEGYFGLQDQFGTRGMMLLLDNDIFYEFIPVDALHQDHPTAVPIWQVSKGINYAIVVTSSCGLWRYMPGDTVTFVSTSPYRIEITGRTTQYINAFGEEVMVSNTDQAIATICQEQGVHVSDYTVAPIYFDNKESGGHQWLIEFEKAPNDIELFCEKLDLCLQQLNSDYEAKRQKNLALKQLHIQELPKGTFKKWLHIKGKTGAQNKIPRLSNDRVYVDEILAFLNR